MPHIWIIDDDSSLRWVLEKSFSKAGFSTSCFEDAYHTLEAIAALETIAAVQTTKSAHTKPQVTIPDVTMPNITMPDVVLSDIRMPGMDGLALLKRIHSISAAIPVIIMTAHSDLEAAVESYSTGAFEYLPKPFDLNHAIRLAQKAIAHASSQAHSHSTTSQDTNLTNNPKNHSHSSPKNSTEKATAKKTTKAASKQTAIIGESAAMQTVFRAIGRLAKANISVLINGESGTGKELIAHALHQHSPRKDHAFIALNMAAIPHDLIEAELFGHEKGAFTGANALRKGRFEQANGGTLFLDEIGDMPFSTQTRLLRVLANGEFFRVGGQTPVTVDVRIIAATHQDLESLVAQGKFREDLFYRLNVIRIPVPALRKRPEDIPALAAHFLQTAAKELAQPPKTLTDAALAALQAYEWKGNVRQLENVCRWITVMASSHKVGVHELPEDILVTKNVAENTTENKTPNAANHTVKDTLKNTENTESAASWQTLLTAEISHQLASGHTAALTNIIPHVERTLMQAALAHTKGRKGDAAKLLGWGRNTFTRKLQMLAVENGEK